MIKRIEDFERKLLEALKYKYRNDPPLIKNSMITNNIILRMKIVEFYDVYSYWQLPQDRLKNLVYMLFDIKIQMYFIQEVDMGLYNREIYKYCQGKGAIEKNPFFLLKKSSFDQNLIIKSRILWERVMNFIYYFNNGKNLEVKKSKKTKFFISIKNTPWAYLEELEEFIKEYDDKYRTPEVHKGSTLRKLIQLGKRHDANKLMNILNFVQNDFWENLFDIMRGRKGYTRSWSVSMPKNPKFSFL